MAAHFWLPNERITPKQGIGLGLAFVGMAWAILSKSSSGHSNLAGDMLALADAWGWAGTAFMARKTRLREAGPEAKLFWMVLISEPILLVAAPFFGPLIRDEEPTHWFCLVFQAAVVAAGVFITWLWLLFLYPTATVASFFFLTPLFAIILGYFIFDEALSFGLMLAAWLVAAGIALINRRQQMVISTACGGIVCAYARLRESGQGCSDAWVFEAVVTAL